jgi:hypothetical protein
VQRLKIFSRDRIFVAPPQEPDVVAILEFLDARRIPAKLLEVSPDCARVLHPSMDELFLAVALHLKTDLLNHGKRSYRQYYNKQHQRKQDVAALSSLRMEAHKIVVD